MSFAWFSLKAAAQEPGLQFSKHIYQHYAQLYTTYKNVQGT